jgi:sulfofructose kinase
MVACARLGLRTKYIGTIGDDERGASNGKACNPPASISITCSAQGLPQSIGLHHRRPIQRRAHGILARPDCLTHRPREIAPEQITCARLLHIDGHDTLAVARAAAIARRARIPVTVDVDTIYHGFDRVLPYVDYLVASSEFPSAGPAAAIRFARSKPCRKNTA